MRYFHIKSNGEVEELRRAEYNKRMKIAVKNQSWLVGWVDEEDILFVKKGNLVHCKTKQIREVLKLAGVLHV